MKRSAFALLMLLFAGTAPGAEPPESDASTATGCPVTLKAGGPGSVGEDRLTFASATRNTYLVVYRRGPAWADDKPMREQPSLLEHFAYYVGLHRKGLLIAGGGFTDESGGAAVFEAESDTAASEIVAADPAVRNRAFEFELQRWKPNPWEEISQKRAARGE